MSRTNLESGEGGDADGDAGDCPANFQFMLKNQTFVLELGARRN
jgi:hypothetical protein